MLRDSPTISTKTEVPRKNHCASKRWAPLPPEESETNVKRKNIERDESSVKKIVVPVGRLEDKAG